MAVGNLLTTASSVCFVRGIFQSVCKVVPWHLKLVSILSHLKPSKNSNMLQFALYELDYNADEPVQDDFTYDTVRGGPTDYTATVDPKRSPILNQVAWNSFH